MKYFLTVSILSCLLISGCTQKPIVKSDDMESSEYLTTIAGEFIIREKAVIYSLTYKLNKPLPDNAFLRVDFENPFDKSIVIQKDVYPDSDEILVQSIAIPTIENRRTYRVLTEIVHNDEVISKHAQNIRFLVRTSLLDRMGIILIR